MKKILERWLPCVFACALMDSAHGDMASFSVLAVDAQTAAPIANAEVKVWFDMNIGWRAWSEPTPIVTGTGSTDSSGRCLMKGKTNTGHVSCVVWKEGEYYEGTGNRQYSSKDFLGSWRPDNLVITMALQRVEHPMPLWVKNVTLDDVRKAIDGFDGTNVVLRYDLVKGDWLPPVGNGEIADFEITSHLRLGDATGGKRYPRRFFTFENTIEFLGDGNGVREVRGLQQSSLKLRIAPESGYRPSVVRHFGVRKKWVQKRLWEETFTDCDKNQVLVFRIRSEFDSEGKLISGYYGKIYGDLGFSGSWKTGLRAICFLYYLNKAPLDRNLEWDMKNNLCPKSGNLRRPLP